jgi:hypothetical protein
MKDISDGDAVPLIHRASSEGRSRQSINPTTRTWRIQNRPDRKACHRTSALLFSAYPKMCLKKIFDKTIDFRFF